MKKFVLILAAAVAALTISSCKKDNGTKTVTVTVSVDESAVEAGITKPDSYVITVTNNSTTTAVTANTENGKAEFPGLVPGIYSVAANAVVVTDGRQYVFTGTEASVDATVDAAVTVKVSAAKESALVFKEIYYTGCKIGEGEYDTYFRDQFWEVYNNSSETVYADGLCITCLGNNYASWDWSTIYEYDIPNPEKYVFVKTVWQIPGTGNQYPIKPGESIVIAQWGTDHTAATLGTSNSINLSGADFEAILGESTLWNGTVITDNKAINMDRVIESGYAMPQWLVSVGDDAIVLFKPSQALVNENFIASTNGGYTDAREILRSDILDAVQWRTNEEDGLKEGGLFLPSDIDAGFKFLGSSYTGESFSRKVAYTREDGTVVYQDTNNSTNDFEKNTKPQVRRNGAGVPSWNTWAK